jgi:biopolymer transport protein ExbD
MRSLRLPRRRRPRHADAVTALINVAFLLMAFFMLIGRMDARAPFPVATPLSGVGVPLPRGGVMISVSATGALALEGAPATAGEIIDRVAAAAAGAPVFQVRVNADARARLADVLPLVGALEGKGVPNIVLVVTPEAP